MDYEPIRGQRAQAQSRVAHNAAHHPSARTVLGSAILTKEQVAQLLGCTVRYIERQIRAGRLRALKPTGKLVRIFRSDIDAFLLSGASIA